MKHQLIRIEDKDAKIKEFAEKGYVHRGDLDEVHKDRDGDILIDMHFQKND